VGADGLQLTSGDSTRVVPFAQVTALEVTRREFVAFRRLHGHTEQLTWKGPKTELALHLSWISEAAHHQGPDRDRRALAAAASKAWASRR
jgi:hypothetical protein